MDGGFTLRRRATATFRSSWRPALACALVAVGLAWQPVDTRATAAPADPQPALPVVGKVPLSFSEEHSDHDRATSGWMILDRKMRRGYTLTERFTNTPEFEIESFDLDSLRKIRRVTSSLGFVVPAGTGGGVSGEVVHAVDEARGRIFIALSDDYNPSSTGLVYDARRPTARVLVLDEAAFDAGGDDWARLISPPPSDAPLLLNHAVTGMTYSPRHDRLLLQVAAYATFARQANDHWLLAWRAGDGTGLWQHPLTDCASRAFRTLIASRQLAPMETADSVVVVCQAAGDRTQTEGTVQIVVLPLVDGRPGPAVHVETLARKHAEVIPDVAGERLLIRALFGGEVWWVYDLRSRNWVGAMGLVNWPGYDTASGLDPATGRLYALAPHSVYEVRGGGLRPLQGGVFFSDTRLTPSPQFTNAAPELAYTAAMSIHVDSGMEGRPTRVFVRRGSRGAPPMQTYPSTDGSVITPTPREEFYLVLEDRTPPVVDRGAADLDRSTVDVVEKPGVTGANYGGAGAGYGARLRMVSGIAGATNRRLDNTSPCAPADRELSLGTVPAAELSNGLASASALAAELDDTSRQDLERAASRCQPTWVPGTNGATDAAAVPWPQEPAVCSGREKEDKPFEHGPRRGAASVGCDVGAARVHGAANHRAGALPGEVEVAVTEGSTEVDLWRDENGFHSRVTATAKGVTLKGIGSIGLVQATAETVAAGRRRTATGSLTRRFCGINLTALRLNGCTEDMGPIVKALNQAFGGRGRVTVPEPDPVSLQGTPGGYLAAVRRPLPDQFTAETINRDFSKAVPALELTYFNDSPDAGSARTIVQLAGVEASSTYGIYLLSQGGALDVDGGGEGGEAEGVDGANAEATERRLDDTGAAVSDGDGTDAATARFEAPRRSRGLGTGPSLLARLFGRPLLLRPMGEALLVAAVWFCLGLPGWFAGRRADHLATLAREAS